MTKRRGGCIGSGCVLFVAGVVTGVATTILALVGWALVRPVDYSPVRNEIAPGGYDLEVKMSEALLNQEVDRELAKRELDQLARIIVDTRTGQRLDATLEGRLNTGRVFLPTPKVETEVLLEVDNGLLSVHIERVGVGPVRVFRETLPTILEPFFISAEDTLERVMNDRIQAEGYEVKVVRSDESSLTLGLRSQEKWRSFQQSQ